MDSVTRTGAGRKAILFTFDYFVWYSNFIFNTFTTMKKLIPLLFLFIGCESKLCSCIKETAIKPNNDFVVIGEVVKPDIDCYENRSKEYTKIDSTDYYYRYTFKCEE